MNILFIVFNCKIGKFDRVSHLRIRTQTRAANATGNTIVDCFVNYVIRTNPEQEYLSNKVKRYKPPKIVDFFSYTDTIFCIVDKFTELWKNTWWPGKIQIFCNLVETLFKLDSLFNPYNFYRN